ncbi:MAG: hypothetical protein K9M03_04170 [Kiritimatiellales bacterium]|nr:hypothetical protein [Kiritimatiellales bacterium]
MLTTLKKLWQSPILLLKIGGAIIIVLIILSLAFQLIASTVRTLGWNGMLEGVTSPSMHIGKNVAMYDYDEEYDARMAEDSMGTTQSMPVPMPPDDGGFSGGDDAEDFEVKEYNATIKTRNKEDACADFADLKQKEYIVFEHANEYERGCSYTFKVEHAQVQGVLDLIEGFDPDDFSESTYTIKRSVEHVTSEMEILEQKLKSVNTTLENALEAYDEISRIATNTRDAESLASIIDSKVRLIERMTQEQININERMSRLERNMQQQMERLDYTYFYVSVREDKYVDIDNLQNSWKNAVQSFVHETNAIAQAISIGVITFVLTLVQYVLYFFILLFVAKFGWKYAKAVWMK